ncbi:DUF397 domain-containing protein [Nocardiopsis sp. CNT-189]|uniref:DUF397 domain-containing protein n=1 Tax=Nocardiopsis oceanisediminis TaxID=2816862 RepID=UPI003B2CEE49
MSHRGWFKSSHSSGAESCVEVREHEGGADVRDTRNRQDGHLTFPASEWSALIRLLARADTR